MTVNKNNKFGLYWVADASDKFQSSKLAGRALNVLTDEADLNQTMNKSRVAGVAIQFVFPSAGLSEWEGSVDGRLNDAGVSVTEMSPISENNNNLNSNANLVGTHEYWGISGKQVKLTLPESVIETIDEAVDRLSQYSYKQKARFVSNAILAWDASVFSDATDRIRTKEQLATVAEGGTVDDPTHAFRLIRDGEVFEGVHEQIWGETQTVDSALGIEPTDDVILTQDAEPEDWTKLPKTKGRVGPFLALLRRFAEDGGDGFSREFIEQHYTMRNSDYDDFDYVFDAYLTAYLSLGADGKWYVSAEASDEELREAQLSDINTLATAGKQKKALGKVVEKVSGESGVKTVSQVPESVSTDELAEVADRLVAGLPKGSYRDSVLDDVATVEA